jgi:pyrimidine-specific ribonucleoside hydrolase
MRGLHVAAVALIFAALDPPFATVNQKPPVIIDTDCGTDDLMAIAYLLAAKEVDLRSITVVNGLAHVEQGARNVLNLLELAGKRNIPVYIGDDHPLAGSAAFPDEWRRLSDGLPGVQLPQSVREPQREAAADYLAKQLRLPPGGPGLRILALGPLTNLARAIETGSGRLRGIRSIVIMGGAINVPGNLGDGGVFKTSNKAAEWNMYIDPLAARRVFACGAPIEIIPLDATNHVPINSTFVRDFSKKAATPLSRFVSQLFAGEQDLIDQRIYYAWDSLAAVILAHPGIASFKDLGIDVAITPPFDGQTRAHASKPANARVALDADAAAFLRLFRAAFFPKAIAKS